MGSSLLLTTHTSSTMVVLVLVSILSLASAQQTAITQDQLNDISKPTGLDLANSFRCGLFYLDPKDPPPGGKPAEALLIFNATWDAKDECVDGGNYERYNEFCRSIRGALEDLKGPLVLASPSLNKKRAGEGVSIGDDICRHLKKKVKAPFVGKKSKKFPDGAEFGMYSNACGDVKWTYSNQKHGERVCCKQGVYQDCEGEAQKS